MLHMTCADIRFHDPRILAATGRGIAIEEKRAWKGFWNEKLVQVSKESFEDDEVVTVLLTGRSTLYADIVTRILNSRGLAFDLVVLKPKRGRGVENSTLTFKYAFIDDVLRLGESIEEVEVYEDRAPHRDAFENYLKNWRRLKETTSDEEDQGGIKVQSVELAEENDAIGLKAFKVHFVTMPFIHLDEAVEESLVRTMLEETNQVDMADEDVQYVLEKRVFGLAYNLLDSDDQSRLFDTYFPISNQQLPSTRDDWRILRQPSVFIHFNASPHIIHKVGGIGKHVEFEVTHLGVSDKVLALSLAPVASYHEVVDENAENVLKPDHRTRFWSKNEIPVLVLATREGGKPVDANHLNRWIAIPKDFENRRFMARVTAKQEISIETISKSEARVRREREEQESAKAHKTSNGRRYPRGSPQTLRTAPTDQKRGGSRPTYGNENTKSGGPRNAFGYSLES